MNEEKPKSLDVIGLYNESGHLKGVYLSKIKNYITLKEIFSIHLDDDEEKITLLSYEEGKKLFGLLKQKLSITAIPSNETLVRSFSIPLKKENDINAVIEFQVEPLLPYPSEDAIIDWIKINETPEGSNLMIFSVKKDQLLKHIEEWKQKEIEPECISSVPLAIASFASYFCPNHPSLYVLHVGLKSTTCILLEDGKLMATQFFQKGLNDLIQAYSDQKYSDLKEAKLHFEEDSFSELPTLPSFTAALEQFRLELIKIFFGINRQLKGEEFENILITGEGAAFPSLRKWISRELNKNSIEISSPSHFQCEEKLLLQNDIPLGLALSGFPNQDLQINFRKKEFAYPHPWKRLSFPLGIYILSCLLFAWVTYMAGEAYLGYEKDQLKERFVSLLAMMDKNYGQFEREYEGITTSTISPLSIEELTSDELLNRVDFLDQEISKAPQPIALMPNIPRVSDLLAWLSNHPNVVFNDPEKNERQPLVQIEHLSYSLVKRPEEKKKGGRYEVKVELEFTSPTPKVAREFHDALIEENTFIDPKGEVKWSSNRGIYRTSFFLVDKTFYPTNVNN